MAATLTCTPDTAERSAPGQTTTLGGTDIDLDAAVVGDFTLDGVGSSLDSYDALTHEMTFTASTDVGDVTLTHTASGATATITVSDTAAPAQPTFTQGPATSTQYTGHIVIVLPTPGVGDGPYTAEVFVDGVSVDAGQSAGPYDVVGLTGGEVIGVKTVDAAGNKSAATEHAFTPDPSYTDKELRALPGFSEVRELP